MTRMPLFVTALTLSAVCTLPPAWAGEKDKTVQRLEATAAAIDLLEPKAKAIPEAASDIGRARSHVKRAHEILDGGRQMFGLGGVKPEAEQDANHFLGLSDLSLATAASRIEKSRAAAELELLEKQLATVKGKIRIFEDRKAEFEKYKAEAAKYQAAAKEIEALKAEREAQAKLLADERAALEKLKAQSAAQTKELEEAKFRAARLSEQLDALKNERKPAAGDGAPAEPAKQAPRDPEQKSPDKPAPDQPVGQKPEKPAAATP